MKDVKSLERKFINREEFLTWMTLQIESCGKESVLLHICGVGGAGKSLLLEHWNDTLENSVLIRCESTSANDPLSRINDFAMRVRNLEIDLPRFDPLWVIKKKLSDGVEPAASEGRSWLMDLASLIPGVGSWLKSAAELANVAKKLKTVISRKYGKLGKWLKKRLGPKWEDEMLKVLRKAPKHAVNLLMDALQSDLSTRESLRKRPLVILFDNFEVLSTKDLWITEGRHISEAERWHILLSGVSGCIGITAGRQRFDENWLEFLGMQQMEVGEFDEAACRHLFEDRGIEDRDLQDAAIQIGHRHPDFMDLICDAVRHGDLKLDDLRSFESDSLEVVRREVWRTLFSRLKDLREIAYRAAMVSFFDKGILKAMFPGMIDDDWFRFKELSFVKQLDEGQFELHSLARNLALSELGDRKRNIFEEMMGPMAELHRERDDPTILGLLISSGAFVNQELAMTTFYMILGTILDDDRYDRAVLVLRAVEFSTNEGNAVRDRMLGEILADCLRWGEAETALVNGLRATRELETGSPGKYMSSIASALNNLGLVYDRTGREDKALEAYIEAMDIWRELNQKDPGAHESDLAGLLGNLGNLCCELGRREDGKKMYVAALGYAEKLVEAEPGKHERLLANILNSLGDFYSADKDSNAAEKTLLRALEIRVNLDDEAPNEVHVREVASTFFNLGVTRFEMEKYDRAEKAFKIALESWKALADEGLEAYLPKLVQVEARMAWIYTIHGRLDEAEKALGEAVAICRRMEKSKLLKATADTWTELCASIPELLFDFYVQSKGLSEETARSKVDDVLGSRDERKRAGE